MLLADYYDLDSPVFLLLGNEGDGLEASTRRDADIRLRIPMEPNADSVNVANAAAIAMYHFTRVLRS